MSSVDLHRCLIATAGLTLSGGVVWLCTTADVRPVRENARPTPVPGMASPLVATPRASLLFVNAVEVSDEATVVAAEAEVLANFSREEAIDSRAEDDVILAGFQVSESSGNDASAVEPVLFTGRIEVDEP